MRLVSARSWVRLPVEASYFFGLFFVTFFFLFSVAAELACSSFHFFSFFQLTLTIHSPPPHLFIMTTSGSGVKTAKYFADIVQSAVCKTNIISRPVPSLFYFPGLNTRPVFPTEAFPFADELQAKMPVILEEYEQMKALSTSQSSDYKIIKDEHELHKGDWEWNSFILKGKEQPDFVKHCPETANILNGIPSLMKTTPFGYSFFSTLKKHSNIAPHTGPCNIRIRCHLPLIVPEGDVGMNLGGRDLKWTSGKALFFDDCYEHHVYNNTDQDRVLLLFDMW
jgi:hypothetical protein